MAWPEAGGGRWRAAAAMWTLLAGQACLAQGSGAAIPYREDGPGLAQQAASAGGIALLLLALAVALLLALRRRLAGRLAPAASGGLRCAASTSLSPHTRVHVLAYRGREYLLAQCGDSLLHIAQFDAPAEAQAPGEQA